MDFIKNLLTSSNSKGPQTCSVCLVSVNPGDAFTDPSGCGHLLHLPCFMSAHSSLHNSCPTCRAPFVTGTATLPAPVPIAQSTSNNSKSSSFFSNSSNVSQKGTAFGSTTIPAEEPLTPMQSSLPTKTSNEKLSDIPSEQRIQIVTTPEVSGLVQNEQQAIYVNVTLNSIDSEIVETSRVGVDLITILDKSGSMGGEKERLLRNALEFVINELNENDRLASISFDSQAKYQHGLIRMTESGKTKALECARGPGLNAGGGTNIFDGMDKGINLLNNRKLSNSVTTIFLLTDGIDDSHLEEKIQLAKQAKALGWFFFIFAFGNDHNSAHLNKIAEAAESSYIFIDNINTVREAFGGAIGSQQGVAGKLLTLRIELLDEGIVINKCHSGHYKNNVSIDKRLVIVSYPNLLIGEKRDCCLQLTVPSTTANVSNLLKCELTYTPIILSGCEDEITIRSLPCVIERLERIDTPLIRDINVDVQVNRIKAIEAIELATSLADQNRLEEARNHIEIIREELLSSVSVNSVITQAMLSDLNACLRRLANIVEWSIGGRAEQMETTNIHNFQRGVCSKKSKYYASTEVTTANTYAVSRSKAMQSKASY